MSVKGETSSQDQETLILGWEARQSLDIEMEREPKTIHNSKLNNCFNKFSKKPSKINVKIHNYFVCVYMHV